MYLLLPCLLLLHLLVLVLLYTATISNAWFRSNNGSTSDLWYHCANTQGDSLSTCNSTAPSGGEEWLDAVRGSMVIAVLFGTASFLIFVCQLYTLRRGSLFYVTAIFQIFSGLCVASAALMYTLHVEELHPEGEGTFGSSYVLSWIGAPITLASGIVYLHLRKLE